jgi:hypothetical protein
MGDVRIIDKLNPGQRVRVHMSRIPLVRKGERADRFVAIVYTARRAEHDIGLSQRSCARGTGGAIGRTGAAPGSRCPRGGRRPQIVCWLSIGQG